MRPSADSGQHMPTSKPTLVPHSRTSAGVNPGRLQYRAAVTRSPTHKNPDVPRCRLTSSAEPHGLCCCHAQHVTTATSLLNKLTSAGTDRNQAATTTSQHGGTLKREHAVPTDTRHSNQQQQTAGQGTRCTSPHPWSRGRTKSQRPLSC